MKRLPVFDPTVEPKRIDLKYAPRPASLTNLRIGLVGNTKFNSDKVLLKIAKILEKEHGARVQTIRNKRGASVPVDESDIRALKGSCDVVIAGIGD